MIKSYSYIRFSTPEQLKGDSLRRQLELSAKYAKENGFELVQDFRDMGVSAFKGKNIESGLGLFLEAVESGKIEKGSYLLIESLDRLSRDKVLTAFKLFTSILEQGINIVTLQDSQTYTEETINNNIGSLFTSLGIMVRANNESETKSKRLKSSWVQKRQGIDNKILTSRCPSWLKPKADKSGFIIINEAVNAIKKIFDMVEAGNGAMFITRRLNEEGIHSIGRTGKWIFSYVKKILKNREVLGELQMFEKFNGKRIPLGAPVSYYYPQIISIEQFNRVQDIISSRGNKAGGRIGLGVNNLFSGLLKCGCGDKIYFVNTGNSKKSGYNYLQCYGSRFKSKHCNNGKWIYQDFEDSFFRWIKEFDLNQLLNDSENSGFDDLIKHKHVLTLDIKLKSDRIIKILDGLGMDELDIDVVRALNNQVLNLKQEVKGLKDELKAIDSKLESESIQTLERAKTAFVGLSERLLHVSPEDVTSIRIKLKQVIRSMVKEITLYKLETINPYDVYSSDEDSSLAGFKQVMIDKGFNTVDKQFKFLSTTKGMNEYRDYKSYFVVLFHNNKSIFVLHNQDFIYEKENRVLN